jgi:hypothetical protein
MMVHKNVETGTTSYSFFLIWRDFNNQVVNRTSLILSSIKGSLIHGVWKIIMFFLAEGLG